MYNLTDVSSEAEVLEDVSEMRPESPESENERVEVPVVNPTSKKPKTFSWTVEKTEDLSNYIREYKSACEFRGIDFEADLEAVYMR